MKVLVLGGSGMVGHTIAIYLKEKNHEVMVYARTKVDFCDVILGDVTNLELLKHVIVNDSFDAVINCVGILNNEADENQSEAIMINSYLPHYLSDITRGLKTKIIHLSTDCVFSGDKGQYLENDFKDGPTFYDRTKALGEIDNKKDLTFRNSIIGPDMRASGIGLFNWFMLQKNQINGYSNVIWTGVTSLTLAKGVEKAITEDLSGIYNFVYNESISKYKLLKLFNSEFRNNDLIINEDDRIHMDKSLVNSRVDFSYSVPSYEQMMEEMKQWIDNHKPIYPHYFKEVNHE